MSSPPSGTFKPDDDDLPGMVDARVRKLLDTGTQEISDQDVLAAFAEWVLPDRQLTIIRERVERWRDVVRRKKRRAPK